MQGLNFKKTDILIWKNGANGFILLLKKKLKILVLNSYFENFILLCVVFNTITLALDGIVKDDDLLASFNLIFTYIFAIEMGLKIIALNPINYIRDKMNVFDASLVILSFIEIFYLNKLFEKGNKSAFGAFKTLRIFRTFRVLRVTRLIRTLEYMR